MFTKFMKISLLSLVTVAGALQAQTPSADRIANEIRNIGVKKFTSSNYKEGTVRHIVLFRYAAGVRFAQKNEMKRKFLNLKNTCVRNGRPYILGIEAGYDNSGEGADQALEQGFIVTFRSQGDRNFYVGQPIVSGADEAQFDHFHDAFKKQVGPLLDHNGALVFDFSL